MLFPFAAASVVVLVVGLNCRVWADDSISTHFSLFQPSDLRGSCGRCFSLCNYRLPLVCLILIAPFYSSDSPKDRTSDAPGELALSGNSSRMPGVRRVVAGDRVTNKNYTILC
uniref:Putative secreted protein n=1 Tax=Anopheles darlingi TaxID=43151 RepID=A0A2M4DK75_ANODA